MKIKNSKKNYLTRGKISSINTALGYKENLKLNNITPKPFLYREEKIDKNWYSFLPIKINKKTN
jgi:hypothetical protein